MELLKKIIAKEFMWFLVALIFSFPLALVPLTVVEFMVDDVDEFLGRIDNQVIVLYLIFVLTCFVGILLIRFVSSAIKTLFQENEEES